MTARSTGKLDNLVSLSRSYGHDPQYVLLGGGNTSMKDGDVMYVKASGHALGTIAEDGFVRMSLPCLSDIWTKVYPQDDSAREDAVLQDLMDCRLPGETARPSVEALLHAVIPYGYVVHLHPAMVNGLTCGQSGEDAARILFPQALWIPLVKPGYILADVVRRAMAAYRASHDDTPHVIFLQNHGIFVGADSPQGIREIYDAVMKTLSDQVVRRPNFTTVTVDADEIAKIFAGLRMFAGEDADIRMMMNVELETKLQNLESFYPISSAFTPDHIVYSGFKPLWIDESVFDAADTAAEIARRCEEFSEREGVGPKVVCVQGRGVFAFGEKASLLFLDTVKVAVFSETFGGVRFMDDDMIDFIRNWEVEQYRSSVLK